MSDILSTYIPTERQKLAHSLTNRYKLFGGAMGGGKSRWLCEEVLQLCMQYPGNRGVICRYHLSDFKNSTFKTLMEVIPEDLIKEFNKTDGFIKLINGSEIMYMGMAEESNVSRLKSMELGWFAIDEASEVPKSSFLLFQSRLRRILPDGKRPMYFGILATNPDDCWLKEYFLEGGGGDDAVFIPSLPTDNPYLPDDYVEQLRKTYPDEWIERFLEGSWDNLMGGDRVIPGNWVTAAINREIVVEDKPVLAIDVARYGGDEIVMYYGKGGALLDTYVGTNQSLTETVGIAHNMAHKHKVKIIAVDDIGMGGGVTDMLRENGHRVMPIVSSSKALKEDKYANLRANMWFYARDLFEKGKVSIPADNVLKRQLGAVKYKVHSSGKLIIEKKDETKRRLSSSPDRADALVMMLWATKFMRDPARDFVRQLNPKRLLDKIRGNGYGWDYNKVAG